MAAVLAADVVGYSRLMEADEDATHARLMRLRFVVFKPIFARHQGQVVKNTGDGFLAMFDDAAAAMRAAIEMQRATENAEADVPAVQRLAFRMGVHVAEVIVEDHDIYGDGVNVAARLQTHAEPGGIVISALVAEEIGGTLGMRAIDLGQMHLRNRQQPVRVLSLRFADTPAAVVGEVEPGHEARPSIAVLPFRKLARVEDDYFADGIVDNIIHALSGLKELFVIARGSTLGFGAGEIDARAIGSALGVRYLLYGSVQRTDSRLRIITELIDCGSAEVLRADHYNGDIGELFHLQDRIADGVVKAIAPHVRDRELQRALRKHAQNMTAYDLVLQALDLFYRLEYTTFSLARGLLQRAMTTDPNYGLAFSYAAHWHSWRIGQGWAPDPAADILEAARLARAAIERDPGDPIALAILGHVHSYMRREYDEALRCFEAAISVSPSCCIAWALNSATLGYVGDGPSAVRSAQTALRLSPLDTRIFFVEHILSQAHYINGNYAEAIHWGTRSDRRRPLHAPNLRILAASLVAEGKLLEATQIAARHMSVEPSFTLSEWAARTPLHGPVADQVAELLSQAGIPG